jgi:hypothetical protein
MCDRPSSRNIEQKFALVTGGERAVLVSEELRDRPPLDGNKPLLASGSGMVDRPSYDLLYGAGLPREPVVGNLSSTSLRIALGQAGGGPDDETDPCPSHSSRKLAGERARTRTGSSLRGLWPSLHTSADLAALLLRSVPGGYVAAPRG